MTAPAFCAGKGYESSTLRYWASRLKRGAAGAKPVVRLARVVRTRTAEVDAPIVVELGGARVVVRRGFDRAVLAAVFDAVAACGGAR